MNHGHDPRPVTPEYLMQRILAAQHHLRRVRAKMAASPESAKFQLWSNKVDHLETSVLMWKHELERYRALIESWTHDYLGGG